MMSSTLFNFRVYNTEFIKIGRFSNFVMKLLYFTKKEVRHKRNKGHVYFGNSFIKIGPKCPKNPKHVLREGGAKGKGELENLTEEELLRLLSSLHRHWHTTTIGKEGTPSGRNVGPAHPGNPAESGKELTSGKYLS